MLLMQSIHAVEGNVVKIACAGAIYRSQLRDFFSLMPNYFALLKDTLLQHFLMPNYMSLMQVLITLLQHFIDASAQGHFAPTLESGSVGARLTDANTDSWRG